jgi:hypothetical protein
MYNPLIVGSVHLGLNDPGVLHLVCCSFQVVSYVIVHVVLASPGE